MTILCNRRAALFDKVLLLVVALFVALSPFASALTVESLFIDRQGILTFASPGNITIGVGGILSNPATSSLAGENYGTISYSSSSSAIATVGEATGLVTGITAGSASITAQQAAVRGINSSAFQSYSVTVTPDIDPDVLLVAADKNVLTDLLIKGSNPDLATITTSLATLPVSGANGSFIRWASSNTGVVSNNGQSVIRPLYGSANATVILTATLTKGLVTDTKTFTLIVKAASAQVITIKAISGVMPPVVEARPVATVTDTVQYTGTVTWSGSPSTFATSTAYTATITLAAKSGYTLTGVAANSFTVAGATSVTHAADSGVVMALFPVTGNFGAATKVLMQTEPVGGASGAPLATQPVVKITDANGNTVTLSSASVTAAIASGTGGTLGGTTMVSAVNGVATFTNLILTGTVGTNYTLQFASSGLTSAMSAMVQVLSVPLAIGDNYCGGIIAYILVSGDPGYVAGQTHGLIAAPGDQSTGILWWNGSYITTGATGTAIGTGAANTTAIVASQGAGSYAAKLCDDLVLNGYSDWYLPSRDELNKLYLNKRAVGGFATYFYWSSSEDYAYYAWYQYFGVGSQYFDIKFNYFHVRAVRAF